MFKRRSKFGNVKTNGFDSKKESVRFSELKLLEKAGEISDLKTQVRFEIIPKTKSERACYYVADFTYICNGVTHVEDVKGFKTEVYKIKRKLFKFLHPNVKFLET